MTTQPSDVSLSESYLECMESFEKFLLTLSEESCRVIHLKQVHLPQILEEYGRAKIWGDQTRAGLTGGARGSLDDTLRYDNELKHLVNGILKRLSALLGQATSIASKKYDPVVGSDHDSISSVSAESDSDEDDDGDYRLRRMPKITLFTQQILEQIRSLYDLSSLLRRPKIGDKYIRSVNSKSNTAIPSDMDALPLNVGFSYSDESHIAEKVLQWRGLTKSGRSVEFKNEDVAPIGQGLACDHIEDNLWFCQQLARANTRRREQLQYWVEHPYDAKQDLTNAARLATLIHTKPVDGKQYPGSQASTLKPSDVKVPHERPKSTMSKQSFSTAAISDIHDANTNVRPRTVYAPTAIGQNRSNSVPDPPKTPNGNTTFPCPYCGTMLDSKEMENRQLWKRHVFRDLRPYICTFKDCQNGGKLYLSRHEWIYHEFQIHRRHYVCKDCHEIYSCRAGMSTHLRKHYGESVSPSHLNIMLELCNRQIDVSDGGNESCLLCGEELSLSVLLGHLAAHMEDIALFVLPNNDVDETGDSSASVQVAKLASRGKGDDTESQASSLGFSEAGDYGQTPSDFAKLLAHEEVGYVSKFSLWSTTEEQQIPSSQSKQLPTRSSVGNKVDGDNEDILRKAETLDETHYIIKCICNFSDDDGNTIYCEKCDTWQHIDCFYPNNRDEAIHEDIDHRCAECKPRPLDRQRAIERTLHFKNATAKEVGPTSALWLDGIPTSTTTETLIQIFREHGQVLSSRILTHNNSGFVDFEEIDSAISAKKALNGKEIFPGAGPSRINFAKLAAHTIDHTAEYEDFMNRLREYHNKRGTTLDPEPKVGLSNLDLMKVFNHIVANGGYDKVSDEKLGWRRMAAELGIFSNHEASTAFSLKQQYYKNLSAFEISTVHGKEPPPKDILEDVTAKGGDLLTRTGDNFFENHQSIVSATDSVALGGDDTSAREQSIPETTSNIVATALPLSEITSAILFIITQFGALEEDRISISHNIQSATQYNSLVDEISALPEPSHIRVHDATKLREIRKRIDNQSLTEAEIETIAVDILPEVVELSSDYIGNTVVQKLFENCSDHIRDEMLAEIAPHIAGLGVHKNGTWAVQKVIDVCNTHSQKLVIVENLRPYTVPLFLDQYGNYILQGCLRFGIPYNNFIFETILDRIWEIAQGRFGARAMRACLESYHTTKDQKMMLAAAIALYGPELAMNTHGALLLTWYLDTCTFPGRRDVLSSRLIPHLAHLCTHKIAYLTVLKLINQREEVATRETILNALFFTVNDNVLETILSDPRCGATFIFKALTMPFFNETIRPEVVQIVKNVLIRLEAAPNQGYRRLMDEVGLST